MTMKHQLRSQCSFSYKQETAAVISHAIHDNTQSCVHGCLVTTNTCLTPSD